jgi:nitroreductase
MSQETPTHTNFNVAEINRLIRHRRSIFPPSFSGEVVPREQIEQLLENAHWAPNHGRTEPWFFKVFSGGALQRLGETHAALYKEFKAPEEFKEVKYNKLKVRASQCSHVIAICMKRGPKANIPVLEEVEAVACAVQNLWLTASAMGIAGYWASGGMTYHPSMRAFLELTGEEDICLGFFMLGYPKDGKWPEGKRESDWREKVEWIEE